MDGAANSGESSGQEVIDIAVAWKSAGRLVALATVVTTWGSSPLPIGSQLVVDATGTFFGSVSGGCIESAVIESALEIIKNGAPKLLKFGVTNDRAWEVGLSCGGQIEVYVERLD